MRYTGHHSLGFHFPSDRPILVAASSLALLQRLSLDFKQTLFAVCYGLIAVSTPAMTVWGQSTKAVDIPAPNAASTDLAMQLRQSVFNAQRQLPWLEQDVSRGETVYTQARQQLDAHKKELAVLTKAIEDLKSAETKSQASLESLETRAKQQKETLKKAEVELASNPNAEKENTDKLNALRQNAATAHQALDKLLGQLRGFEQAIQFNTQRRGEATEQIGKLDGQLRSKREFELQLSSRLDEAAAEKTKLQSELGKLEKQAVEQRDALKAALNSVRDVATRAKELASQVREFVGNTSPSATNKPADDKPAEDKPAEEAEQAAKASERPTATASPSATTALSALTDYQSQLAKLQEAYQLIGQRNQTAQATLEQLSAIHLAIAQAEAKVRDVTTAKKNADQETQSAKETLVAAEKEMEKLTQATSVLRERLAELKRQVEATTTEAGQFDKELAELDKQLATPASLEEQLALKAKLAAAESARRELVQIDLQLAAEKSKIEQIKRALEFNLQMQTKLQWQVTIAEEVNAVRELEHATAKASLASVKLAAEALSAALQKLESRK